MSRRLFRPTALSAAGLALLGSLLLLSACSVSRPPAQPAAVSGGEEQLGLSLVGFSSLPGWSEDRLSEALPALRRSCERFTRMSPNQVIGGVGGLAGDWLAPCGALRRIAEGDEAGLRNWAETWFQPYLVTAGGKADGLFTGYYEAELRGSRVPDPRYPVPLYPRPQGWPADPAAGQTYLTRAEIEAGALRGRVPELLWVDDPVDAHILHIQGSGRVLLEDGSVVRVGYNGNNGYKFVGLGKILLDQGKLAPGDSSMQAVRAWLKSHPAEAAGLMAQNPRYVFFRLIDGDGPIGAAGLPLTPGRSLAVDPRFIPLGVPVWLDSSEPDGRLLRRLMLAQDTGAAIKGVVRGDVFWGPGEAALERAGRMRSRGLYYLLLPRARSGPVAMLTP